MAALQHAAARRIACQTTDDFRLYRPVFLMWTYAATDRLQPAFAILAPAHRNNRPAQGFGSDWHFGGIGERR